MRRESTAWKPVGDGIEAAHNPHRRGISEDLGFISNAPRPRLRRSKLLPSAASGRTVDFSDFRFGYRCLEAEASVRQGLVPKRIARCGMEHAVRPPSSCTRHARCHEPLFRRDARHRMHLMSWGG